MKVLNLSSSPNFKFNNSLSRAGGVASRSFSTTFSGRVLDNPKTGSMSGDVPITTNFNLSVSQVSSLDQVGDTDFLSIIVDNIDTDASADAVGVGQPGSNLSLLEAGAISGSSPEVLLHELGHNLELGHTPNGNGLMGADVNGQTGVSKGDLRGMLLGLGVTGAGGQSNYSNTQSNAVQFLKDNTGSYDKNKANKAGAN